MATIKIGEKFNVEGIGCKATISILDGTLEGEDNKRLSIYIWDYEEKECDKDRISLFDRLKS